jgi:hypothetical protein
MKCSWFGGVCFVRRYQTTTNYYCNYCAMTAPFQAISSNVMLVHLVSIPSAPILNKVESRLSNCVWACLDPRRGKLKMSGSLFYISVSLRDTESHEAENSILIRLIRNIFGFYGHQKSLHIECRKDVQ